MSTRAVARRYAEALFASGEQRNLHDQFLADAETVLQALQADEQLVLLLAGKQISIREKKLLLEKLFGEKLHPYLLNLLYLLIDKERGDHLQEVFAVYRELLLQARGILGVEITTAEALLPAEEAALAAALKEKYGVTEIIFAKKQDPQLISGAVLKVGDTLYDGSLRHQLQTMRKQLIG